MKNTRLHFESIIVKMVGIKLQEKYLSGAQKGIRSANGVNLRKNISDSVKISL
ncbi:hypothetical protein [Wolbachia endosymbiont (group A) of Anomoia purmunda]|uniref:hypothetical protein n=1 Tax=Wolbachia endosymbiont (group A) of Anomoia purmunda TaxID=2953978 RepID=UPI00222E0B47|nr:hypothetical protein [Wolbachia endosymbiont (group A) of Anomoia purmunda]